MNKGEFPNLKVLRAKPFASAVILVTVLPLLRNTGAYAHGIVGNRVFLSPIVGNDAFPDNALDQKPIINLQMQALRKAGCKKIFREKLSGASRERQEFQRMLDQLRTGDTIIVWKLDRLARSTGDLFETMETIREAGARFQSLSEPWADTTSHAGKLIMTVFAGIAEFERDLIRKRTSAGRAAARRRGIHFGRPRKLNPEHTKLARRLMDEGQSVRDIADTFNVHTATIYRLSKTAA